MNLARNLVSWFLGKSVKLLPPDALIFSSKCTEMRLAAGLRPDPLGELKRSPRPPSRKKGAILLSGGDGRERRKGGVGRGGEGKERGKEGALLISGQRGLFR